MKDVSTSLRVRRVSGSELEQFIPELARLRIEVFREFPYLYDGSLAYEQRYLASYATAPGSVIVLAIDANDVVGAATGMPLSCETDEVQRPFVELGYAMERIYYFAESVLDKRYRGRGIGVQFFQQREAHVRQLGGIDTICFCGVDRPADHPRRPDDYVTLDSFWIKRGYTRHPEIRTTFSWQDLDESEQSAKPMVFWIKSLAEGDTP